MNTLGAMLLYLAGSFALIIVFVKTPSIQFYTGGVVIGLFMAGIFFAAGNSILQTRRLEEALKKEAEPAVSTDTKSSSNTSH